MATDAVPWEHMTEAEQAGLIQRTAVYSLDSPYLRQWSADDLRRESPEDPFMCEVADAMDAEVAAREARKRLRVVAGARWRLPTPGARHGAPGLRLLEGCLPSLRPRPPQPAP